MKIVFLGDSITLGYGLDDREKRFSTLVCRVLGAEEINYGITGTLIARAGLSREDGTAFVDRMTEMEDADAAVIFGGTNDYYWSDRGLGDEGSEDTSLFFGALNALCRYAKEKYPRVILITPYEQKGIGNFRGGADFRDACRHPSDTENYSGLTLGNYADAIRKAAKKYGLELLDLNADGKVDIAHSEADYAGYTLDGCHPNETGHAYIAEHLLQVIRTR